VKRLNSSPEVLLPFFLLFSLPINREGWGRLLQGGNRNKVIFGYEKANPYFKYFLKTN
jgi:hypothetical protein